MSNNPKFYKASDYAGLRFKCGSFYYGYEESICRNSKSKGDEHGRHCDCDDKEWCFLAKINGEETLIPFSKLGCKDMFDVVDCLNTGIGWVLSKWAPIETKS